MDIKISKKRLAELEKIERKMAALEAGGVDNWEFYGESLDSFFKENDREEKLKEMIEEIEIALMCSAYEPSERGAGYAATDDAREEALKILTIGVNEIVNKDK
jgi:hypothetical protein